MPIILALGHSKKETVFVFVVFLVWGALAGTEAVKGWVQGASFLEFGLVMFISFSTLSVAFYAAFELLSTRKLTIGPDKVLYKYKTPFKKGEWQASYKEYTSLEFMRNPVKCFGRQGGYILVVELVHPNPLQTVPLIMCSPVHETRVREILEGLREYFGLPLFDRTGMGEEATTGIQDWSAAARVPQLVFRGTLLFIPAAIILSMSYYLESIVLTTDDWKQTTCTIVQSEMNPIMETESKISTHEIDVLYQYQVDGKEYQSRNYSMAGNTMTAEKSQRIITQYPEGSQTVCYINPKNPTEAILYQGSQSIYAWLRVPAWIMFVGSLFFLRRGILNWRNAQKSQDTRS